MGKYEASRGLARKNSSLGRGHGFPERMFRVVFSTSHFAGCLRMVIVSHPRKTNHLATSKNQVSRVFLIVWGLYTGSTYLRGDYAAVFPSRNLATRRLRGT